MPPTTAELQFSERYHRCMEIALLVIVCVVLAAWVLHLLMLKHLRIELDAPRFDVVLKQPLETQDVTHGGAPQKRADLSQRVKLRAIPEAGSEVDVRGRVHVAEKVIHHAEPRLPTIVWLRKSIPPSIENLDDHVRILKERGWVVDEAWLGVERQG